MHHDSEKFNRGNKAEEEQLLLHGLEKNYNPVREIDPKTGIEGTTIPDALKNEGKSTTEIKNVKEQSLSRQLRLQERFSNSHGLKPLLIINEGAHLTRPLIHSSFEIQTYNFEPVMVKGQEIEKAMENQKSKPNPLSFNPNPLKI